MCTTGFLRRVVILYLGNVHGFLRTRTLGVLYAALMNTTLNSGFCWRSTCCVHSMCILCQVCTACFWIYVHAKNRFGLTDATCADARRQASLLIKHATLSLRDSCLECLLCERPSPKTPLVVKSFSLGMAEIGCRGRPSTITPSLVSLRTLPLSLPPWRKPCRTF